MRTHGLVPCDMYTWMNETYVQYFQGKYYVNIADRYVDNTYCVVTNNSYLV